LGFGKKRTRTFVGRRNRKFSEETEEVIGSNWDASWENKEESYWK